MAMVSRSISPSASMSADDAYRRRFRGNLAAQPEGHQRARSSTPRPIPAMGSSARSRRRFRTTMPLCCRSASRLRKTASSTSSTRRLYRCVTSSVISSPTLVLGAVHKMSARPRAGGRRGRAVEPARQRPSASRREGSGRWRSARRSPVVQQRRHRRASDA